MKLGKLFSLGLMGMFISVGVSAAPIASLAGLTAIRFYEVTGVVTSFDFAPNSSQLTTQLSGPLGAANRDFFGLTTENYDVFYSDANGSFNLNGEYISIVSDYPGPGSGLNIGEVELLFSGPSPLASNFATGVVSHVPGFTGFVASSLANIGDNDINTATQIGNTANEQSRFRITVGFAGPGNVSEVPEPATVGLTGLALVALGGLRYRRNRK